MVSINKAVSSAVALIMQGRLPGAHSMEGVGGLRFEGRSVEPAGNDESLAVHYESVALNRQVSGDSRSPRSASVRTGSGASTGGCCRVRMAKAILGSISR